MIQLLDELKGKVESDLSAEEKMMEEYDLAHISIWIFSDMFGSRQERNDSILGLTSPNHTANWLGLALVCTEADFGNKRLIQIF